MPYENYKELFPLLSNKLILNVDDNEVNQLIITRIMENAGMAVISAENGQEAMKKLEEGLRPDFILLDMEMPVMNGIQTARLIKQKFELQIPIIINSGYVATGQKWQLARLGINEFLQKPYYMKDIFSLLSNILITKAKN